MLECCASTAAVPCEVYLLLALSISKTGLLASLPRALLLFVKVRIRVFVGLSKGMRKLVPSD